MDALTDRDCRREFDDILDQMTALRRDLPPREVLEGALVSILARLDQLHAALRGTEGEPYLLEAMEVVASWPK